MDAKTAAYKAYKDGASKGDIARIFKVSANTVTEWSKKGKWDETKRKEELFKESSTEGIQNLIAYNIKILNWIRKKREDEISESSSIQELEKALTSKGDIDALQKLYTTIRGKDLPWETKMKVAREFMEYLDVEDNKLAQKVVLYVDEFINEKRKGV